MKKFTLGFLCLAWLYGNAQSDSVIYGKIPIDPNAWYQLDNVSNGLQELFDGNLYQFPNTGYGKILNNYDSYYQFPAGMDVTIDSIKLFDWEGSLGPYPASFFAIPDSSWQRIPIATFVAGRYDVWTGPDPNNPDSFALPAPMQNVRYLVLNAWYQYPAEVEFYGSYKAVPAPSSAPKKFPALANFFGVNGFEWDFENPATSWMLDTVRMHAAESFTALRHYVDWQRPESVQGEFTYNPMHDGGWNYDTLYTACKAQGITVLTCLKTVPSWMLASYPANEQDPENVPVWYGADFTNPASYIDQAMMGFQFAARYGSNTAVNPALVTVDSSQRWTGDPANVVKIGLGLVKYIECDNERDKWWKGRQAYQTGREYAANLSAFYDGNMGLLGPNVGVKTADPNMQVVMGGLANATVDYVRGMIDWCKEFRGYKPDGTVNFCWDVINYHLYANDARGNENAWPSTGVAPELSINDSVANNFIQMAHQYAGNMPVWVTEVGYDINQGSPDKAIAIGNRTALETQGDWILRTALQYAKSGLQRTFFYEMYDDNPGIGSPYATSGLLNDDFSRRPAADFMYQVNKLFGKYHYQKTISSDPEVDRYANGRKQMYALWIPDETGRTGSYNLNLGSADTALVYQLQEGSDSMSVTKVATTNGYVTISVTETPQFVAPLVRADSVFVFGGFAADSTSMLQWQASNDSTCAYYVVESSTSAASAGFTEIGRVTSTRSTGAQNRYTFNDAKPAVGVNYYRVRKVDVQGNTVYSKIIALHFGQPLRPIAFPNPATESVTVQGLPQAELSYLLLTGSDGKVIERKAVNSTACTFNLGGLASGVYYVTVIAGGKNAKVSFVKAQ